MKIVDAKVALISTTLEKSYGVNCLKKVFVVENRSFQKNF